MNNAEFIVYVKVLSDKNQTFTGHILGTQVNNSTKQQDQYDHTGAVYYILAVILLYSCSIMLMIGSIAKKKNNDVSTYMMDLEKIRKLELKQEKFRTILMMHNKKVGLSLTILVHPVYSGYSACNVLLVEVSRNIVSTVFRVF